MASRTMSPGGALLRSSRMFSIPAPLPQPNKELASTSSFNSNTATLPHPVRQSIVTPRSSQFRGDWGFKRPLPLKSTTKSSTPVIRVDAVDTFEHVTSFASAADHTLTLEKWQEMNMPLTTPGAKEIEWTPRSSRSHGRGVFEDDIDITTAGSSDLGVVEQEHRWKFKGPWLAGQTESDFRDFIQQIVRKQQSAFKDYIRRNKAIQETQRRREVATEKGEQPPPAVEAEDITEDELREYIRQLRSARAPLFKLVREFFDLPPAPPPIQNLDSIAESIMQSLGTERRSGSSLTIKAESYLPISDSPYANTGPPKTHPSAGLSYLRSNKYIYNHPVFGPQASPAPIQGRVLLPKSAAVGGNTPKLGVAGVVTDVPLGQEGFNMNRRDTRRGSTAMTGITSLELDKKGGSKVWLKPTSAHIDPKGRVTLKVAAAAHAAVAIHEGTIDDEIPSELRRPAPQYEALQRSPKPVSQGYGLGTERPSSNDGTRQ